MCIQFLFSVYFSVYSKIGNGSIAELFLNIYFLKCFLKNVTGEGCNSECHYDHYIFISET